MMSDLIAQGQQKPAVTITMNPDDVASLLYTSGTTKMTQGSVVDPRELYGERQGHYDERD